jgi:uncharacterized membrane protein
MNQVHSIFKYLNFGLFILLTFLFIFENNIVVESWKVLLGRVHPLFLHLPIGIFTLLFIVQIFRKKLQFENSDKVVTFLADICATTACVSAVSGLILAAEDKNVASEALTWHKYGGGAFALLTYLFSLYFSKINDVFQSLILAIGLILLIVTGHNGATMTHGEDFLKFKIDNDAVVTNAINVDSSIYRNVIHPILESKCIGCHNTSKQKGNLLMIDSISLFKGGESGTALIAGQAANSLLFKRMLLPESHEEHMPPIGKAQLTFSEVQLIEAWINNGASYRHQLDDISSDSTFYTLVKSLYDEREVLNKIYPFKAVSPKVVSKLNTPYRKVYPLYHNSPALAAVYLLSSEFKSESLNELSTIKDQIVEINLNKMPLDDKSTILFQQFKNLEKLYLNTTKITNDGIKNLTKLNNLHSLSIANTKVDKGIEKYLGEIKSLKNIFLTNTDIDPTTIEQWRQKYPKINIVYEDYSKIITQLSPPIMENIESVVENDTKIELKHYIKDVVIKYTLDGTEPDSISSPSYEKPFKINKFVNVKAKAFKDKWISSDSKDFIVYTAGFKPKEIQLTSKVNDKYKGEGAATLTNGKLGLLSNLVNPNWLGYSEEPFKAKIEFDEPKPISTLILSYGYNILSYVFPPTYVKLMGGDDPRNLKQIAMLKLPVFDQNNKEQTKNDKIILELEGKPMKYYEIHAQNLQSLPQWHPGKGTKAWFFIDEIFFY